MMNKTLVRLAGAGIDAQTVDTAAITHYLRINSTNMTKQACL